MSIQSYSKALDFLFSQLPMYQRQGKAAYKTSLDNTIALCEALDNPQKGFKSIHIGGTNGKGSTASLLTSILQERGLKVGLYTSPHLKDYRERIRINGKKIKQQFVIDFINTNQNLIESIQPSFFEMTMAMAFQYFNTQKVDIAIIEVGLGGRLDSTNIIIPLLSVITNIGFDHTQFLGTSLPEIATEKAGIIKHNIPIIIGETQEKTTAVFLKKAAEAAAPIYFADKDINDSKYQCGLKGNYQLKNIKTVLKSVVELNKLDFNISSNHIKSGLLNVVKNTGILGKWQTLLSTPLTICDTGHNEDGIHEVVQQIGKTSYEKLHFVIGFVNDKNIAKIISILPKKAIYYYCCPDIPRGLNENEVAKKCSKSGLKGNSYFSVNTALKAAQKAASNNDLVFIGGSTFVVAEAI